MIVIKNIFFLLSISLISFYSCSETQSSVKVENELIRVSEDLNKYLPMETNNMVMEKVTVDDSANTLSITYHYAIGNYFFENDVKPNEKQYQMYYCFNQDFEFFKINNINVNWKYSNYNGDLLGVFSVSNCK